MIVLTAFAPPPSIPPISTDRPTFSDGASLVPKGYVQFESGVTGNETSASTTYTYGELLTRYGLSNRFELRLSNVTWTQVPGQTAGLQDPSIGVKFWIQTGSAKRPDLSGEVSTTIPAGGTSFRVNRTQPTLKLIWNQQIDPKTTLTGNFLVSDLGPQSSRYTQWGASAFLTRAIDQKLSLFAEIYGLDPVAHGAAGSALFDLGATYLLSNDLQVDARFGAGFNQSQDAHYLGAGISYRF